MVSNRCVRRPSLLESAALAFGLLAIATGSTTDILSARALGRCRNGCFTLVSTFFIMEWRIALLCEGEERFQGDLTEQRRSGPLLAISKTWVAFVVEAMDKIKNVGVDGRMELCSASADRLPSKDDAVRLPPVSD